MNEYDYDLWGLDVNNFEILPAAAVLLKGEIIPKEKGNLFEIQKKRRKKFEIQKKKRKKFEIQKNCEITVKHP
jgi:hypothetical protein